ncbi:MAG: long-chain fatty acid--CoA ligase, partial [Planctomycetes bacterium]|nr:long-chain fatty acid--CoA ligase [Planctomycetota bacterium]
LLHGSAVHKLLRSELDRLITRENGCRPTERITTFRVLCEPMTPENGLLTHTLKVRRHIAADRFARIIASMFDGKD